MAVFIDRSDANDLANRSHQLHWRDMDNLADGCHRVHSLHGGLLAVRRSTLSQHQQSTTADRRSYRTGYSLQSTQVNYDN